MVTMVMPERRITATRFKAQCLRLLDEVAETGQPLVVTKRGKPVVRVLAANGAPPLRGSVTFAVSDEDLIELLGDRWDAEDG